MPSCSAARVGFRHLPQLHRREGWQVHRLPSCDGLGELPRLLIVADAREPAKQLDGGRELATTIECGTDRSRLFLRDITNII